jgi:hypothetical protein
MLVIIRYYIPHNEVLANTLLSVTVLMMLSSLGYMMSKLTVDFFKSAEEYLEARDEQKRLNEKQKEILSIIGRHEAVKLLNEDPKTKGKYS